MAVIIQMTISGIPRPAALVWFIVCRVSFGWESIFIIITWTGEVFRVRVTITLLTTIIGAGPWRIVIGLEEKTQGIGENASFIENWHIFYIIWEILRRNERHLIIYGQFSIHDTSSLKSLCPMWIFIFSFSLMALSYILERLCTVNNINLYVSHSQNPEYVGSMYVCTVRRSVCTYVTFRILYRYDQAARTFCSRTASLPVSHAFMSMFI